MAEDERELNSPESVNLDQTDFLSQSTFSLPEKEVFPRVNTKNTSEEFQNRVSEDGVSGEQTGAMSQSLDHKKSSLLKSPLKLILIIGGAFLGLLILLLMILLIANGGRSMSDNGAKVSDQTQTETQKDLIILENNLTESENLQSILVLPQIQQTVSP